MTSTRRILILIGLTVAVIVGASIPASATFSEAVTVPTTVETITVAAPTSVSTGGTKCVTYNTTWNATTNSWNTASELQAKVSWKASTTTKGVIGYLVNVVLADGTRYPIQVVPATTLSVSGTYDVAYAQANLRVSVTTLTSYGWIKESAPSGVIRC
jgi:hypothetical protein